MAAPTLQGCLFGLPMPHGSDHPKAPAGAESREADPDETGLDDTALISRLPPGPVQRPGQARGRAPTGNQRADGSETDPVGTTNSLLDSGRPAPMLAPLRIVKGGPPESGCCSTAMGDFLLSSFSRTPLLLRGLLS